jgi:hypothetical protein
MAKKTKAATKPTKKALENLKEFNLVDNKIIDPEAEQKESASESMKAKKISHFDIIDAIFSPDVTIFQNFTDAALKQNFFMLNRTFSIKYPEQAAAFNMSCTNGADATRVWNMFMRAKEKVGKKPSFVYTKGAGKTAAAALLAMGDLDKKTVDEYCRHYNLSQRDFKDMIQFWPEQTVADVKAFEMKHNSSNNGFKAMTKAELKED